MAFSTTQDLRGFHGPASGATDTKLAILLDVAGWEVEKYAPPPNPVTTDYEDRAIACELLVAAYLFDTGGYISGDSLSGVSSTSFDASGDAVREKVRNTMGPYYQDSIAYLSRDPL
jgi:hypothetical protein